MFKISKSFLRYKTAVLNSNFSEYKEDISSKEEESHVHHEDEGE